MLLPDCREAPLNGKTVLLRADLNVPVVRTVIVDHSRVASCALTVGYLLGQGARVIIMAHLDRPHGVANPVLSMAPVAEALGNVLNRSIRFVPTSIGAQAERLTGTLAKGGVAMLENLRFHTEEEANDRSFALMLSVHGDLYVNDAPACSIRRHASIHAIAALMPAYAGPQLLAHVAAVGEAEALRLPGVEALFSKSTVLEKI